MCLRDGDLPCTTPFNKQNCECGRRATNILSSNTCLSSRMSGSCKMALNLSLSALKGSRAWASTSATYTFAVFPSARFNFDRCATFWRHSLRSSSRSLHLLSSVSLSPSLSSTVLSDVRQLRTSLSVVQCLFEVPSVTFAHAQLYSFVTYNLNCCQIAIGSRHKQSSQSYHL